MPRALFVIRRETNKPGWRMTDLNTATAALGKDNTVKNEPWAWRPSLPIEDVPVLVWPPRPLQALKYLLGHGFLWSQNLIYIVLAIVTWFYLAPALERCVELKVDWILQVYALNLGLVILVAGGLHLFFHTFKCQGKMRKFDPRELDNMALYDSYVVIGPH